MMQSVDLTKTNPNNQLIPKFANKHLSSLQNQDPIYQFIEKMAKSGKGLQNRTRLDLPQQSKKKNTLAPFNRKI